MSLAQLAAFIDQLPAEDPARAAVLESWERCLAARLAREGDPVFCRVPEPDLYERLARNRVFVDASLPLLQSLLRKLPGTSNVAYVTDAEGIVLCSAGPDDQLSQFGLLPGFDWSEARMGTNGAGTCLVTRRPVVVAGPAHYMTAFHDGTCTAAPIRGAHRRIVGALDVSSRVGDAHPERIQLVVATAAQIEERLLQRA